MKKYIYLAFTIAILASCAKDRIKGTSCPETDSAETVFRAVIADGNDTRAYLSGSSSDSVRSVYWNVDDRIAVSNGTIIKKFVNAEAAPGKEATFVGEMPFGNAFYAFYPFSETVTFSTNSFSFVIPPKQKYVKDGVDSGSLPMVAKMNEGRFEFKNLCGVLVVRLTGTGRVSSIILSGCDDSGVPVKLSGEAKVAMDFTKVPVLTMSSSALTSVVLDCSAEDGGGVALDETTPVSFHIVVPANVFASFSLTVLADDGSSMRKTSDPNKPMTVKRAERTTLSPLEYEKSTGYLNDNGSANCYIISSPGTYKFDATRKGNSNEYIGAGASAEVVWETFGTTTSPSKGDVISNVGYDNGIVTFTANADGNALIAVKNSAGVILWSWHIWISQGFDPSVTAQKYYNGAGIVMDRDLGAIYRSDGELYIGLTYQWGRKDPFFGNCISNSSQIGVQYTGASFSYVDCNSETGTIDYSIKHPFNIILSNSTNNDWLYPISERPDTVRWGGEKTTYDPCPPGWKVPGISMYSSAIAGKDLSALQWDDTKIGCNMSGYFGPSESIWYYGDVSLSAASYRIEENDQGVILWAPYVNIKNQYIGHSWTSPSSTQYLRCVDERHSSPRLGSVSISGITGTSATLSSYVTFDGGYTVTEVGFAWSTAEWVMRGLYVDETQFHKTPCMSSGNVFSLNLTGLASKQRYYVRPYAVNEFGVGYGDMAVFETYLEGNNGDVTEGDEFIW